MKKLIILFLIALFAASAAAQEKCDLALNSAPALFKLKLRMNAAEAKHAVDGKLKIKNKAEGTFFQNYIKKSPPKNLDGIRAIYLRFFDSKLYQIEIFYEPERNRISLEDFLRQFSAEKELPFESWKVDYGIARLDCDGFFIEADNYLNPRVQLTDEVLSARFEESQKDEKKKK